MELQTQQIRENFNLKNTRENFGPGTFENGHQLYFTMGFKSISNPPWTNMDELAWLTKVEYENFTYVCGN